MRLHEIEDIKSHEFIKYFQITPNERKNIVLSSSGIIVDGDCECRPNSKFEKLPFKFKKITGNFTLDNVGLTSLEGCPEYVGGSFQSYDNKITSLIGGPKHVGNFYGVAGNPIVSLDGLPERIGDVFNIDYHENLALLRLLTIPGLTVIELLFNGEWFNTLADILNKYVGKGKVGIIQCAAELTKAGFKGNARL